VTSHVRRSPVLETLKQETSVLELSKCGIFLNKVKLLDFVMDADSVACEARIEVSNTE
jgi:hypothetical protein